MNAWRSQRGALMIEVLVTIVILAIGLLGLMQMQGRLQKSEVESYQRTQALILLNDMASRMNINRTDASSYPNQASGAAPVPVGANMTCPTDDTSLRNIDLRDWCLTLQGAAETQASARIGAMVGARGCIEELNTDIYMVTVAWQGLIPISAPPADVACGINQYDIPTGSACADNPDFCRRYVTTLVRVADLRPAP